MMVSLITPCYNLENYIRETYVSICSQTVGEWEWIIVDDGSSDGTIPLIESLEDDRIKLIRSEHTGNLSILRNKGVRKSTGEFLAFIDGDDIFEPRKLELQLKLFQKYPSMGWSHTRVTILQDETSDLRSVPALHGVPEFVDAKEAFGQLIRKNYVYISSVMVRKKAFTDVGGFKETFNRCEDIDLWLRLTAHGYAMGYIDTSLLQYRVRKSGLFSSKTLEYLNTNFRVYEEVKNDFPELYAMFSRNVRFYLSNNHLKIAIQLLGQNRKGFVEHFKKSLFLNPSIKKMLWFMLSFTSPSVLRNYLKRLSV